MCRTTSHAAAAASRVAPTMTTATHMLAFTAGVTGTAATTTTTIRDAIGAADITVGPTAVGAHRLPGAGDGAELLGLVTMDISSIHIPFMLLQRFGSPIT